MKSCTRCHALKPLTEFDHSRRERDGHHHRCKTCDRKRDRERLADGSLARSNRRWQAFHPDAAIAHRTLRAAVKASLIERGPCVVCGKPDSSHGHHDDYSKPLSVEWRCHACHACHVELHRLERLNDPNQLAFNFWEAAP